MNAPEVVPVSINISADFDRSDVLGGFRATRKAIRVVRAVVGVDSSQATHVVAPYGAGKSIAALAGITLVAGSATISERLRNEIAKQDGVLANSITWKRGANRFVLLHGASRNLAKEVSRQIGVNEQGSMRDVLKAVSAKLRRGHVKRLAIVWDEFGQHLETLVREGRSEDLLAVQDLAEWTVRQSSPVVTFTTLMHRGAHHYGRRMSDNVQRIWRKVEGRFDTLRLIDDGIDAYEMIADEIDGCSEFGCEELASRARECGFFETFPDDVSLSSVLARTAPLTPAALDVMPRMAATVAQNERSMFRFLDEADVVGSSEPVGLEQVYDFFAPAMQADVGPGGTYRRFVESESAMSRTETWLQCVIVKAVTLLKLGSAAERVRLPRDRLVFAVWAGSGIDVEEVELAVDQLVERKVLLHRRRVDDISLWIGADIDLASIVAEESTRLSADLDVVDNLERLFPPDAYTSPEFNHVHSITRFARARYVRAGDLLNDASRKRLCEAAYEDDAMVALVIDETFENSALRTAAGKFPRHCIAALPRTSMEIPPVVAELLAIESLLQNGELIQSDPLVSHELHEFRAAAEVALRQSLDRVMNPDRGEVVWMFHFEGGGGRLATSAREQRLAMYLIVSSRSGSQRRRTFAMNRSSAER